MMMVEQNNAAPMPMSSASADSQCTVSPPSPAAQDLNLKIASVKTFWDIDQMDQMPPMSMSNVFDQGYVLHVTATITGCFAY